MNRRKEKKSEVWMNREALEKVKNWVLNRTSSESDRGPFGYLEQIFQDETEDAA